MVPQIRESRYNIESYFNLDFLDSRLQQSSKSKNFCPPSYIYIERRRVSFDERIDVFEVEMINEKYHDSLWYSDEQISTFSRRSSERNSKSSLKERDARSYNHTRRVLFHHNAYRQMGDKDDIHGLEYISRQSSMSSKRESRIAAMKVEKQVKRYNLENTVVKRGFSYYMDQIINGLR